MKVLSLWRRHCPWLIRGTRESLPDTKYICYDQHKTVIANRNWFRFQEEAKKIATMAALVLGLLIASAKSSFDAERSEFTQMSTNVVLLDRILAHYGPETKEARDLFRIAVVRMLDHIWPKDNSKPVQQPWRLRGRGLWYL